MNGQKHLMIIGASILQLPAIIRAKDAGYRVAVADYNPNAVGVEYADEYFNVSTIDEEGVFAAAEQFGADGIMTLATDMPMRAVASACARLGLPGISYDTAVRATDKGEMIKSFAAAGVSCPAFKIVETLSDMSEGELEAVIDAAVAEIERDIGYPVVCKPTDNSGSRGVMVARDEKALRQALRYSCGCGRSGRVIAEEYMRGSEVSVEVIVYRGAVHVLAVTDKLTTGEPHFVELGHSQQSALGEQNVAAIKSLAADAVRAVGIDNSAAHVEIMLTREGPKMVELGARMGGDCITTHLVPLSTGIDMVAAAMDIALGNAPDLEPKFSRGAAIRYLAPAPGRVCAIEGINGARGIEGVRQVEILVDVGDTVGEVKSSGDRAGFVIAQADSAAEAVDICTKAAGMCRIVTVSDGYGEDE